jgi:class 3 adenylate cyclase
MSAKHKILVVDDEDDVAQLIRQKFRREIRDGKYEFVFAQNGKEALLRLDENPDIEVVLSDINMPEMDGLTLLQKINEAHPLLKTVIISAYGDMPNIRTAMNRGAFDFITKPLNFNDLEQTLNKTLRFSEQLRETVRAVQENNILKMYVDESVLRFMCSQEFESSLLVNETIEATIAFIDICGFTAISEREPPDVVVRLLNKYFDIIVKAIIVEGGSVDKFMGDAVLAVFKGEEHLARALRSALTVNANIQSMKDTLSDAQTFLPKLSTGINTGEVISGNIGSDTLRRFDFTVIGDVVNTAQRLQSIAQPGQILINQATYEKAGDRFQCRKVGEVALKNKANPVVVWEVVG